MGLDIIRCVHSHHFTITWDPILSILNMEATHSSKKTSIKLQHTVSKFWTLQSEQSPQTVRIQVFWHMMLCWWVSGSRHLYGTVFLQNDRNHMPNNAVSYPSRHECSETMCDNFKSHFYANSLTVLASYDRTLSSILGNFIHNIHSGQTGFGEYFPPGFVNYLPSVTILSLFTTAAEKCNTPVKAAYQAAVFILPSQYMAHHMVGKLWFIILYLINRFQQHSSRTYQTSNEKHQLNDNWSKECSFYCWTYSMVYQVVYIES